MVSQSLLLSFFVFLTLTFAINISREIDKISNISGNDKAATVNKKLQKLKDLAGNSCIVCDKEIRFRNPKHRKQHCKQFKQNEEEFGLITQFDKVKNSGAIFLVATRPTRATKCLDGYEEATEAEKEELISDNGQGLLPWHSQVLLFKENVLYVYDSNFDDTDVRFASRLITRLNFRDKILRFLDRMEVNKRVVNKIFVGGGGNTEAGICRTLSFQFMKDYVKAAVKDEPFTKVKWFEFKKGGNPTIALLEEIHSI